MFRGEMVGRLWRCSCTSCLLLGSVFSPTIRESWHYEDLVCPGVNYWTSQRMIQWTWCGRCWGSGCGRCWGSGLELSEKICVLTRVFAVPDWWESVNSVMTVPSSRLDLNRFISSHLSDMRPNTCSRISQHTVLFCISLSQFNGNNTSFGVNTRFITGLSGSC